jgi:hypothetical protein
VSHARVNAEPTAAEMRGAYGTFPGCIKVAIHNNHLADAMARYNP